MLWYCHTLRTQEASQLFCRLWVYSVEKLGSREFASDLRLAVLATVRF